MKNGYKDAKAVKVINTPTVKIETEEMEKPKPMLHLDSDSFKAVENWEVGKEYTLTAKVKMVGKNMRNYKGDGNTCGDFEILDIEETK